MRGLHSLSLTTKIVALVALLGALAVAIAVYSLVHLRMVDRDYRALLEGEAQAAVLVTAAAQDLSDASRVVFAVLTEQEEDKMRAALGVLKAQQSSFEAKMTAAAPLLPAASAQLQAIGAQQAQLFALADTIVGSAARWRGDRALQIIHDQFEPLLAQLRHNMEQVRASTVERFQGASAELGRATAETVRNTAWASGLTLVVAMGLALWFSLLHITRPIRGLTRSMERLAGRDYAHTIAHTGRGDEVGQMAQTLEVFRSALQHSDYLEVAKTEAEQLAQAKSSFLATMSHEIRTPLNAIIGLAQSSLRRALPADQRGRMEKIQRAGEHLLGVINSILDFSKLEGGFVQVESVPFAPQQLLQDVRVLLAARAAEKSLILRTEADADMPVLVGDPLRIRQILFNFASNAIKFSERGTVCLRLTLEQGKESESQSCWLYAEVSDQGMGLTSAQLSQLFQPFRQADASTSRRYGGTGLGLAISRGLAELLGGSVGARSQPGEGSCFWLRVPVRRAPPGVQPLAAQPQAASPLALRGLRALLVDDNDLNRLVGSELLADAGMLCDEAQDGRQAIELLEQAADGHYDVVLMDMMMPGMDGCSATRLLRRNPRFARLPVIAMTANSSQQDVDACLAAGMQALVPKPIDEHLLWNTLLEHCSRATGGLQQAGGLPVQAGQPADPLVARGDVPTWVSPVGWDCASALERLGFDDTLYARLGYLFIARPHDEVAQVQRALAEGDAKTAIRHVHTLQGQAATLGAMALQQAARHAQSLIEQGAEGAPRQAALDMLAQRLAQDVQHLQGLLLRWEAGRTGRTLAERSSAPSAPLPQQQVPRLLVVDDQPENALVLQRLFEADHRVTVAHSGEQALAHCRDAAELPDLILLDVVMPDMDGLQVCRSLKADARTAGIPVLFVTAQSTPQEESAALAAGGVDFISKPVNQAVVRARVQTHLTLKAQSDQLRRHALRDGLTGLANRRRFDEALAQEWRAGQRHRRPLALVLIDIDHFKRYNDHYGHPAGDECLRQVAQALQQHMGRAHDVLARYGGEEFACVLPGMTPEDALRKAQALCASVVALGLPHAASPVADCVTISAGVAVWLFDRPGDVAQLLAEADAALYAAKRAGRNRAMLAP